jgi:hypothetical protein
MAKRKARTQAVESSGTIFPFPQSALELKSIEATETAVVLRETEFLILPDGRMIDLIKDHDHGILKFLVWDDGKMHVARHVDHQGLRLVVPSLDATVISALRLPTVTKPCPPIRELFFQIRNVLETYVEITAEAAFLVAAFILSTWFADRFWIVPYLSICGLPESGKTTLLRILHCLCRRGIHAAAITRASIYRLSQVRPTLLIDEAEFTGDRTSRDLQCLLRGGNRQGARVLANGKAFENFGPKVLASRVSSNDAALNSRTINITMVPSDRDMPPLGPEEENELSDTLQGTLQTFRFSHYAKIAASQDVRFLSFPRRLRDMARALAAGLLGDNELLESLARALESQVQFSKFDRFSEPEWVVMLAVFGLYHFGASNGYVHGVTDEVNRILHENGERHSYTPKMVGRILNTSLGFSTHRRGEGYSFDLLAAGRQIHRQAKAMGLTRSDTENSISVKSAIVGQPCDFCSEFGLMVDHEGRKMRTMDEVLGPLPYLESTS